MALFAAPSAVAGEDTAVDDALSRWQERCLALVDGKGSAVCSAMLELVDKRINLCVFTSCVNWDAEPPPTDPRRWFAAEDRRLCAWLQGQLAQLPSVDDSEKRRMPDSPRPAAAAAVDDASPTPAAAPAAVSAEPADAPTAAPAEAAHAAAAPAYRCTICRRTFSSNNKLHKHLRSGHRPLWPPRPPSGPPPPAAPLVTHARPPPLRAPRMVPPPQAMPWWLLAPPPPQPIEPFNAEPLPPRPRSLTWKRSGYYELPKPKEPKVDTETSRRRLLELNCELADVARRAISRAEAPRR